MKKITWLLKNADKTNIAEELDDELLDEIGFKQKGFGFRRRGHEFHG